MNQNETFPSGHDYRRRRADCVLRPALLYAGERVDSFTETEPIQPRPNPFRGTGRLTAEERQEGPKVIIRKKLKIKKKKTLIDHAVNGVMIRQQNHINCPSAHSLH